MRHAWTTVAVVSLASVQTSINLSVVFVVFVDLADYFPDAGNAQLSWAINSFTIVTAATVVLGAAIGDRFGRKRIALTGTFLFATGSVVAGVAPGIGVLIAGRCIQALGGAMAGPSLIALIFDSVPFERRGIAIGIQTMGGGLSAAAGPALGGLIVEHFGWRWAFLAAVPAGIAAIALGALVFRESHGVRDREMPDAWGSLMLMAGVGSLILALVQSDDWGWTDPRTVVAGLAGTALVAALLQRSRHHPRPIIDLALYRYRSFRIGNTVIAAFAASFFTMQFAAIFFLTGTWGYGIDRAGLLASPFFLGIGLMGPIAGRYADQNGPGPVVALGSALWTAAIIGLTFVAGDEPNVAGWLVVVSAAGLGSGLVWSTTPTLSMEDLEGTHFARASAINQTMMNTGNALAIAIAITLLGDAPSRGDYSSVFVMVIVLGAFATVMARTAGPRVQPAPTG